MNSTSSRIMNMCALRFLVWYIAVLVGGSKPNLSWRLLESATSRKVSNILFLGACGVDGVSGLHLCED
jgi:hypothetical protein